MKAIFRCERCQADNEGESDSGSQFACHACGHVTVIHPPASPTPMGEHPPLTLLSTGHKPPLAAGGAQVGILMGGVLLSTAQHWTQFLLAMVWPGFESRKEPEFLAWPMWGAIALAGLYTLIQIMQRLQLILWEMAAQRVAQTKR